MKKYKYTHARVSHVNAIVLAKDLYCTELSAQNILSTSLLLKYFMQVTIENSTDNFLKCTKVFSEKVYVCAMHFHCICNLYAFLTKLNLIIIKKNGK